MLLGRVPSSPIKCVQLFGLQRCLSHSEASPRWHSEFISHFLKPSAHRTSFKTRFCRSPLTVSDMQTDSFSCGRKSPAVVRDEMDGGGETEGREVKEVPDQLETIGMELQQAEGVIGQSTASVSSSESTQEKRKRKIRDGGRRVDREEDAKKKKKQSQRPNYFISIPITNTQVMSLLGKIRKYNSAAAKELEKANFRTDSEIKSLDRTDLYELFPEKKNLKLRNDIIEIIHPKRPVKDLVRELKGFIPHERAFASSGVVGDYLCILKEMETQMDTVQTFINAHIDLLEDLSKDPPLHKTDALPAAKSSDPSGPATFSNCQTGHIPPETRAGNSSDLLPSVLREVKYNMIVDGQTLNAHQQLMNGLLSQQQAQVCQFSESSDDHQVTLLFKPISSHMESDVEAAMSRIKDNKPVILVLMHHFYQPKSTSSPRILKDHPNVVLTVHVFFHDTKSGLFTCRENSAAISSIRDKLLQYSTLVIPGENLQGVSERRNLEAEGGEVLRCLESSRCTSAGDFDGTDCFSGAKTTDPSGPVTFSSPPIGHIPPGTPGNSSDLLPSVLREVKYNMIVDGQTLNAHQPLMNELLSQQQAQDCQFSESSDDHQVTLLFKPISFRKKSEVEAAMSRIKDNKPVILVLMHHIYQPKFTSSQRILKDHPNVVLAVHVFVERLKFRLLTCSENSAAISNIRDKLLEYSRPMISGENLQGVSERRNLEAEGGGKKQHFYDDQKSGKKSSDRPQTGISRISGWLFKR